MLRWERRDRIVMVILMTWVCPYWPELRHEVIALIDTVTRVKVHWVRSYHLELMKWFLASGFKCRSCFLSHADPNILTWWVYVMNVCVRGVERWQDICQGQWWSRGDQWHMVRPGQQGWTPLVTYSGSVSLSWHHDHHCSPLSSLTCVLCPAVSCSNN